MAVDFEFPNSVKRMFVLINNIGCTIADIFPSWVKKSVVAKEYKIDFFKRIKLKRDLDNEFFVWSWVISQYISVRYLENQDRTQEAELIKKIFSDYIAVVAYPKMPVGREAYDWWVHCVDERITKCQSDPGCDDEGVDGVDNYLIGLFALRLLKIIQPKTSEMSLDQINGVWGDAFLSVKEELIVIEADYIQVIQHCLDDISDEDIDKEFLFHLSKGKLIHPLVYHWRQEGNN
ncbi:MAG: hypothetical protein AB1461_18955 [Thermodesulfobacteriota bacterium]